MANTYTHHTVDPYLMTESWIYLPGVFGTLREKRQKKMKICFLTIKQF